MILDPVALFPRPRSLLRALACVAALAGPAAAAPYAYEFTLTVDSERIYLWNPTAHPDGSGTTLSGWVDPALFGVDEHFALFSRFDVGDSVDGRLTYDGLGSAALFLGGIEIGGWDWASASAEDPDTGDVDIRLGTCCTMRQFRFITGDGYYMDDRGYGGRGYSGPTFHGYASYFTLSGYRPLPETFAAKPLSTQPLPPAPILLLTGLAGLALLRRRARA